MAQIIDLSSRNIKNIEIGVPIYKFKRSSLIHISVAMDYVTDYCWEVNVIPEAFKKCVQARKPVNRRAVIILQFNFTNYVKVTLTTKSVNLKLNVNSFFSIIFRLK